MEQIDFEHSQYLTFFQYGLSKEKLQSWLDYKKDMFDSITEYTKTKQRKLNPIYDPNLDILFYEFDKLMKNDPYFRIN